MPTYRSITLSLVSQFDILTIPEFAPPATPNDPFSNAPTLINPDHSLVSVYVPTYPASQFWLSYSISPPHPPKLLYYFKLYINGNLIVSWGCGEDDGYKGKTMFGLYDSVQGRGFIREELIERRVLCFSPEAAETGKYTGDNLRDVMEIKVFRSKGRKRINPDIQEYQSSPGVQHVDKKGAQQKAGAGINLVNAGFLSTKHPKRFYKYALLDPLDTPFATFRYYYRTWDQLEALGIISPTASDGSSSISSQTPMQKPLSPQSSSNTLDSLAPFVASYETLTAQTATEAGKSPSKNDSSDTFTGAKTTAETPKKKTPTSSPTGTEDISPLKIPRINTLRLHRPPTPPPSFMPKKTLAQLPPTIPATLTATNLAGHALTPKESFATLIRTSLPSPDPSAFQLRNPSDEDIPRPPSPLRVRSTSMSALKNVVASAKNRRNLRRSEESGLSGGSGGSSNSQQDETRESIGEASVRGKDKLVEAEREKKKKKRKAKEEKKTKKKKSRDEGGNNPENGGELQLGGSFDKKGRKLHLWEEL